MNNKYLLTLCVFALASCSSNNTYTQKESPNNAFKDYKGLEKSVLGVGTTISERKSAANATISYQRKYSLNKAISKLANKYNLSVSWDESLDRFEEKRLMAKEQTFNEARSYLEDIYNVSIIRQRDRAIKVMAPATVKKLETFNPGPNVTLSEAVNGLAGLCGINLVIADYKSVLRQEKITTNLENISCRQAFEAVLDPFGLSLKSRGSHYTISGLPYKEWNLNLHEQERQENNKINYSSEFSGGGDEDAGGSYVSGGSSSTTTSYSRNLWESLEKDLKELLEQSCKNSQNMGYEPTQNLTVSESFEGGSLEPVEQVQTSGGRERPCGYVRINDDIGSVQMQAPRRVIEKADDLIATLEEVATRRLLVEARILAVSKERGFERGADIKIADNIFGTKMTLGYNPATQIASSSVAGTLKNVLNATTTTTGGGLGLKSNNLDAVVRYVESFGTTYQLMKPTLEVMDRQRATLIDGRNEKYYIRTASVDNSGDTPVVTTESEEKVQFIGVQFSVSAQVAEEKGDLHTVALQIPITEVARYTTVENQVGNNTVTGEPIMMEDQVPIATTRVIDQKVRLRDGDIKVIGGLTKTIAVDKETGVPLLKDVPVAGKAFSEESVTYEDVEFVVLLQVKRLD
jgi:hypothetical protein